MDGSRARALLGVPEGATIGHIGRAFRGAAFDAHPDRGGDAATFRRLLAARDLLAATAPADPVVAVAPPTPTITTAAPDPYASVLAPIPVPRLDLRDRPVVRHRAPTPRPPVTTGQGFASVLADVLAEVA